MQTNATSTVHDSSAKKSITDLKIQKKIILIKKVRCILLFIYVSQYIASDDKVSSISIWEIFERL